MYCPSHQLEGCASTERSLPRHLILPARLSPSFISSPLGESLRHLFLAGNPICLLPAYRERILRGSCAPGLLVLDDLPVSAGERCLVAAAAATATAVTNADAQGGQEASRNRTAVRHGGHARTSHEALGVVHFGVKVWRQWRFHRWLTWKASVDGLHDTGRRRGTARGCILPCTFCGVKISLHDLLQPVDVLFIAPLSSLSVLPDTSSFETDLMVSVTLPSSRGN